MTDLTIREVSERLGTCKQYVADAVKHGRSPNHYRCPCSHKTIMIPESDIELLKPVKKPGKPGPKHNEF